MTCRKLVSPVEHYLTFSPSGFDVSWVSPSIESLAVEMFDMLESTTRQELMTAQQSGRFPLDPTFIHSQAGPGVTVLLEQSPLFRVNLLTLDHLEDSNERMVSIVMRNL